MQKSFDTYPCNIDATSMKNIVTVSVGTISITTSSNFSVHLEEVSIIT